MALPPDKAAARLRLIARETRRLVRHGRALADALDGLAAELVDDGLDRSLVRRAPRERRRPQPTQGVVIEMLRSANDDGLSVSEMIRQARYSGYDLIRPTVTAALDRLLERGFARRSAGRWTLVHPSDSGGGAS